MNVITKIETERLVIRTFLEKDYDPILALLTCAETMKYTGFKIPQSINRAKELLQKWKLEGNDELGVWAVEDKVSNEFIGWVMLKKTDLEAPELGYMISRNHRGKGYATEIGKAIINYGLETLGLRQIFAVTNLENTPSVKVLEGIGMSKTFQVKHRDGCMTYQISSLDTLKKRS